ncbi:MAG: hypothetical protein ACOCUL_04070 [Bacteroidota bacterium]
MKKLILIFLTFLSALTMGIGQEIVGMNKAEVIQYMKENKSNFIVDGSAKNTTFKFLKFVDRFGEETLLAFLSEDNLCTSTRLISDYSNMNTRVKELNKKYAKIGENKWEYEMKGIKYIIELKKDEWYFTIQTKKKE